MDEIKIHYNKTATNIRHNDDIGNASKVHNWIKSLLINRFCSYDSTIIDIGCGRGGDVKKYKKSNVKLIVGIDLSDKSLVQMENRYKKESILFQLKCADACAVEFPSDVDAVVANFSFHYFFDGRESELINKIYKSLKKRGLFLGNSNGLQGAHI
jgi:mRNA (guanine-N7-)-methyltransferase